MTTNNGGPAFPSQTAVEYLHGMSLRDWFAGQALSGFCATLAGVQGRLRWDMMAGEAYEVADAMLAARAKGGDA